MDDFVKQIIMIEPKKRVADMAVVPSASLKRPRTELVAAAQSQQLVGAVLF